MVKKKNRNCISLKYLKICITALKKKNHVISLIRSPHVFKKSRDQIVPVSFFYLFTVSMHPQNLKIFKIQVINRAIRSLVLSLSPTSVIDLRFYNEKKILI